MIVKHLLMFMFKKNIVEEGRRKVISMMDPTCGTGGFAHAFMKYVERWNREEGERVRLNVYENDESCMNDEREIEWMDMKIGDMFDLLTMKMNWNDISKEKNDEYKYPVISRAEQNNGIHLLFLNSFKKSSCLYLNS